MTQVHPEREMNAARDLDNRIKEAVKEGCTSIELHEAQTLAVIELTRKKLKEKYDEKQIS